MKVIQPVNIWQNGENLEATLLNASNVQDNLDTSATFQYSLLDSNQNALSQGSLTMGGQDYIAYSTNTYAWDWIASTLKLTIIGDYVPPVIEPIVLETATVVETPIVSEEIITE
jgi:hypothetical protein